jgi:hypothetical protein
LFMKNLHKFFNKEHLPWVKLIWTSYFSNRHVPDQRKKDHSGGEIW